MNNIHRFVCKHCGCYITSRGCQDWDEWLSNIKQFEDEDCKEHYPGEGIEDYHKAQQFEEGEK